MCKKIPSEKEINGKVDHVLQYEKENEDKLMIIP